MSSQRQQRLSQHWFLGSTGGFLQQLHLSVTVEVTPRVDVDETPCCISPDPGADITSLKTSSFIPKDQVPFQVFVSVPMMV